MPSRPMGVRVKCKVPSTRTRYCPAMDNTASRRAHVPSARAQA
jgi:hypothetical protein